jgi:hypothetical protein
MIVVDITSKGSWIHDFDHTRVNENAADDQSYDATKGIAPEKVHRSEKKSNAQRPTPNAQSLTQTGLGLGC